MKRIIVIGGGPGGYVCAIRAAQLGAEVSLIEKEKVGGTCLNVGCIPTKALLHGADTLNSFRQSPGFKGDVTVDWLLLQKHKQQIVSRLVSGVSGLLKANGVKVYQGAARLYTSSSVKVNDDQLLEADAIVIATGSLPLNIPFPGADLEGVIDSTQALSLKSIPDRLVILGGGAIGMEFAYLYRSLGTKVTVVELLPQILSNMDEQITAILKQELERQGIQMYNSTKLLRAEKKQDKLNVTVELSDKGTETLVCDKLLVAAGRKLNTSELGLEEVGVELDQGAITVDENFLSNVPGIFAIGDCNGQILLAHAASAQGIAAAEHIMGQANFYAANTIPSVVYTNPQAASVGLSEKEAKRQGIDFRIGVFPLAGNGKALIDNGENGIAKLLVDEMDCVIGAHLIGPGIVEMISEMALAISMEATIQEITAVIHPHPSISESWAEAALSINDEAIHWPPQGRR